jgi:glycosyltransferase involved in cell wall biosynthesis
MRVLHVSCVRDPYDRTGDELLRAWPTLPAVARAVRGTGPEVVVLQAAHVDGEMERDGVRYRFVAEPRLGRRRPAAGFAPWRLARAAAALEPDVIHLNGLGFPFHTRALCGVGAPVLAQDHADTPSRRAASLHRWGLARLSGVAFTSAAQAQPFFSAGLLRTGTPVYAIPESSTHFTPGDRAAARRAMAVHGRPAVLWIGRLNANKDPLTVVDAFARALPRLPDAHLWCCYTEAPLLDQVRARTDGDPRLAGRVHLLGTVDRAEAEQLCRACDIFVSASRSESAGFALLEAIACGATPVVTDIPAFRALTGDGTIGALVPAGDPAAFADALVRVAGEPADVLRARAIGHFQRELSFPVVGARLVAAYEALVQRHRAGRAR